MPLSHLPLAHLALAHLALAHLALAHLALARLADGGWWERLRRLLQEHSALVGWLTTASVAFLIISLVALPWLIARLPDDYFTVQGQERIAEERRTSPTHKWLKLLLHALRNAAGVLIALAGVAMLVLPGQGIIAILVGLMLVDYPSKHRFERWLIAKPWVHKPLNWLRKKASKPPFTFG